jgi:hypothetical protein
MTSGFHNFNSNIGNQVIGTLNIRSSKDGGMAFIQQQLDAILERTKNDVATSSADSKNALHAVEEIRRELASKSPNLDIVDRSLKAINGISSVASLVGQVRALLPGVF